MTALRKLKAVQKEDDLKSILKKRKDRMLLLEYLEMDQEDLNKLLAKCNYSDYFIRNASDLQIIDAVLECHDKYKAVKEGEIYKN